MQHLPFVIDKAADFKRHKDVLILESHSGSNDRITRHKKPNSPLCRIPNHDKEVMTVGERMSRIAVYTV